MCPGETLALAATEQRGKGDAFQRILRRADLARDGKWQGSDKFLPEGVGEW